MKVLLVEDNQIVIMGIQKTLLAEFPTTIFYTAENGKEGLDLLTNLDQKDLPDFILLDINMPIMNGIEFLKRIKKARSLYFRMERCSSRYLKFGSYCGQNTTKNKTIICW